MGVTSLRPYPNCGGTGAEPIHFIIGPVCPYLSCNCICVGSDIQGRSQMTVVMLNPLFFLSTE